VLNKLIYISLARYPNYIMSTISVAEPEAIGPFTILEEYRLLVCKVCRHACLANEVITHLRSKHRTIPAPRRREIVDNVRALPHIIQNQAGLRDLRCPAPTTTALPWIVPPHVDGLACRTCSYVVRNKDKIKLHCRTAHGQAATRKRSRPAEGSEDPDEALLWRTGVRCQRFFTSRHGSSWFEVEQGQQVSRLYTIYIV
jgi:hypothetical protein